ncbi:MAG: hypothetical protein AAFN93_27765 [Bacteroidota bacterium]
MKTTMAIFLTLVTFSTAFPQSYKIKKNILYKGKETVAQLDGAVGLTKIKLQVKTMDNDPVLQVDGHAFTRVQPSMEAVRWYTFSFPQFNKTYTIPQQANYLNTKQFIKKELAGIGINFYSDGFKAEELDNLKDMSDQIKEDTLKLLEEIDKYVVILNSGKVKRLNGQPLEYRNYQNIKGTVITQGYRKNDKNEDVPIIIGKITYYKNEGQSISDPSRSHRITIYKKMPMTVEIDGRTTDFVAAGFIDLLENIPNLYLYEENRYVSHTQFTIKDRNLNDAKRAAKFMEELGLL